MDWIGFETPDGDTWVLHKSEIKSVFYNSEKKRTFLHIRDQTIFTPDGGYGVIEVAADMDVIKKALRDMER